MSFFYVSKICENWCKLQVNNFINIKDEEIKSFEDINSLPYNLDELTWDSLHYHNKEGKYCYCGKNRCKDSVLYRCVYCSQWFHRECLTIYQTRNEVEKNTPTKKGSKKKSKKLIFPINGDPHYRFSCKLCEGSKKEKISTHKRFWFEIAHIILFNLYTTHKEQSIFDEKTICNFAQENYLELIEDKIKGWQAQLIDSMHTHPKIFEYHKNQSWSLVKEINPCFLEKEEKKATKPSTKAPVTLKTNSKKTSKQKFKKNSKKQLHKSSSDDTEADSFDFSNEISTNDDQISSTRYFNKANFIYDPFIYPLHSGKAYLFVGIFCDDFCSHQLKEYIDVSKNENLLIPFSGFQINYDIPSLTWDNIHYHNQEGKYCYCGKNRTKNSIMYKCQKCEQWFHIECLKTNITSPESLISFPLEGDTHYTFICCLCSSNGMEKMKIEERELYHDLQIIVLNLRLQSIAQRHPKKVFSMQEIYDFGERNEKKLPTYQSLPLETKISEILTTLEKFSNIFFKQDELANVIHGKGVGLRHELNPYFENEIIPQYINKENDGSYGKDNYLFCGPNCTNICQSQVNEYGTKESLKLEPYTGNTLSYDLSELTWDEYHFHNEEGKYCYCGKNRTKNSIMYKCQKCEQWFHIDCLKVNNESHTLQNYPNDGDNHYVFHCAFCHYTGQENLASYPREWRHLVQICLYNLSKSNLDRLTFSLDEIYKFTKDNWSGFSIFSMDKIFHLKENLKFTLEITKELFYSDEDGKWGLIHRARENFFPCFPKPKRDSGKQLEVTASERLWEIAHEIHKSKAKKIKPQKSKNTSVKSQKNSSTSKSLNLKNTKSSFTDKKKTRSGLGTRISKTERNSDYIWSSSEEEQKVTKNLVDSDEEIIRICIQKVKEKIENIKEGIQLIRAGKKNEEKQRVDPGIFEEDSNSNQIHEVFDKSSTLDKTPEAFGKEDDQEGQTLSNMMNSNINNNNESIQKIPNLFEDYFQNVYSIPRNEDMIQRGIEKVKENIMMDRFHPDLLRRALNDMSSATIEDIIEWIRNRQPLVILSCTLDDFKELLKKTFLTKPWSNWFISNPKKSVWLIQKSTRDHVCLIPLSNNEFPEEPQNYLSLLEEYCWVYFEFEEEYPLRVEDQEELIFYPTFKSISFFNNFKRKSSKSFKLSEGLQKLNQNISQLKENLKNQIQDSKQIENLNFNNENNNNNNNNNKNNENNNNKNNENNNNKNNENKNNNNNLNFSDNTNDSFEPIVTKKKKNETEETDNSSDEDISNFKIIEIWPGAITIRTPFIQLENLKWYKLEEVSNFEDKIKIYFKESNSKNMKKISKALNKLGFNFDLQ